ncbi:MAG: NAD-dependent epimerase/dehydratase family protein [Xanthobacteraceae bacterium]|nr:NAD-dependent epimerase/dehydratase family protein [Xanthobacteraceae bacterium]
MTNSPRNAARIALVTGGTGFIGRHLCPSLENRGWIVRRAVRKPSAAPNDVDVGSFGSDTDWDAALSGVETVIHMAARAHNSSSRRDAEAYTSLNTDATLRLAACCARAGIGHFVFLSTILVNGTNTDGRAPFSERDPPAPKTVYAASKAGAERGLADLARSTAMKITVIRPPLVYGNGAAGNFGALVRAVRSGVPLPFGAIDNRRGFIFVGNLVSFIEHQLEHPRDGFEIFQVADPQQVSTPEFISQLAAALGVSARLIPLPRPLLKPLFAFAGRHEAYDSVARSMVIDTGKASSTGWSAPFSLPEGLARTVSEFIEK